MEFRIKDTNYISSEEMKIVITDYYKKRNYILVGTELRIRINRGYYFCDAFACDLNEFIEFEIKTSKKDLYSDLKTKEGKHKLYTSKCIKNPHAPNKFYFVVTEELYNDFNIKKHIEELNPNYGIICIKFWGKEYWQVDICKSANNLHKNKPKDKLIKDMYKKLSAENISLRKRLYMYKKSDIN